MSRFRSHFAFFRGIVRGHATGRRIPLFTTLCVTNRCNLRCRYCYERCGSREGYYHRNHPEMTTQQIMDLIDQLAAMGGRYLSINGGECLLRHDMAALVEKVKEKRMLCHISTNGLLVKQHLDTLRRADSIAISLDGDRQANDANRGDGSFDRILAGFETLRGAGIAFHIHTVLTNRSLDAVEWVLTLAKQYGTSVQFSLLRHEDSPDQELGLDDATTQALLQKLIVCKERGDPVFFSAGAYRRALAWPFPFAKQMALATEHATLKDATCYLKRFSCHIEANGLVHPCIVQVNKFPAKNFLEDGFEAAWEHLARCSCDACYNICLSDLNRTFGLKPDALVNSFGVAWRRISRANVRLS